MIEFSRMLCPVDFSDPSRAALESALMLARWYRSTVHVPYIVQIALPPAPCSTGSPLALTPAQQARMIDMARILRMARAAGDKRPEGVILATTADHGAPKQ